jgi:hypothetical protein
MSTVERYSAKMDAFLEEFKHNITPDGVPTRGGKYDTIANNPVAEQAFDASMSYGARIHRSLHQAIEAAKRNKGKARPRTRSEIDKQASDGAAQELAARQQRVPKGAEHLTSRNEQFAEGKDDQIALDPAVSERQERAMQAAAHGESTLGIPRHVGQEFVGHGRDEEPNMSLVQEVESLCQQFVAEVVRCCEGYNGQQEQPAGEDFLNTTNIQQTSAGGGEGGMGGHGTGGRSGATGGTSGAGAGSTSKAGAGSSAISRQSQGQGQSQGQSQSQKGDEDPGLPDSHHPGTHYVGSAANEQNAMNNPTAFMPPNAYNPEGCGKSPENAGKNRTGGTSDANETVGGSNYPGGPIAAPGQTGMPIRGQGPGMDAAIKHMNHMLAAGNMGFHTGDHQERPCASAPGRLTAEDVAILRAIESRKEARLLAQSNLKRQRQQELLALDKQVAQQADSGPSARVINFMSRIGRAC